MRQQFQLISRKRIFQFITLCIILSLNNCTNTSNDSPMEAKILSELIIGTYTKKEGHVDGKAAGISQMEVLENGQLQNPKLIADNIINPSYLSLSQDNQFLYAASETGPDVDSVAYIYAYGRKEDGNWEMLNRQSSFSFAPCYISVHPNGKVVAAANYVGGIVALYPLNEDGSLQEASTVIQLEGSGPHPRQDSSHPHSVVFSPDGKYCYIPDLGANKVWIYRYEESNHSLQPTTPGFVALPANAGPRHIIMHPNAKWIYVINELSSSVAFFQLEEDGYNLDLIQDVTTLPSDIEIYNTTADIHLTSDGKNLYASNRGHNSIAHFSINPNNGQLNQGGHYSTQGNTPRNFAIAPNDQYLYVANQDSDSIVGFKIAEDGTLDQFQVVETPTPVCLKFSRQ